MAKPPKTIPSEPVTLPSPPEAGEFAQHQWELMHCIEPTVRLGYLSVTNKGRAIMQTADAELVRGFQTYVTVDGKGVSFLDAAPDWKPEQPSTMIRTVPVSTAEGRKFLIQQIQIWGGVKARPTHAAD